MKSVFSVIAVVMLFWVSAPSLAQNNNPYFNKMVGR